MVMVLWFFQNLLEIHKTYLRIFTTVYIFLYKTKKYTYGHGSMVLPEPNLCFRYNIIFI